LDINVYLQRINYAGHVSVTFESLRELHRCHVMAIPFEALDVQWKRPISVDLEDIFDKVIVNKRGGLCYELNYLFAHFLRTVGFDVTMVSARIFERGEFGPEFDHMALIVRLEEEEWLLDVGYGDLFIEPLKLRSTEVQPDQFKDYRVELQPNGRFLLVEALKNSERFRNKYSFDLVPREVSEFVEQCLIKQTSPESHFVKNIICTIPTETGRKTILNNTLKVKSNDQTEQVKIESEEQMLEILRDEFAIDVMHTKERVMV